MKSIKSFSAVKLLFFVLAINMLGLTSCQLLVKQGVKKGGKMIMAGLLMLAAEEVLAGDVLEAFENSPSGQAAIQVTINNQYNYPVTIGLSNDGQYWEERPLNTNQALSYTSSDKGLIAVKSGNQFYMLKQGSNYRIVERGGRLVVEAIQ